MNKELEATMKINVNNLAETQHAALKQHVYNVLELVRQAVEREDYQLVIDSLTFDSPAGDGYGTDNNCINFAYAKDNACVDITEILNKMLALKSNIK